MTSLLVLLLGALAAAHADLGPAWKALRDGEVATARAAFEQALRVSPQRLEALNGLGFTALREEKTEEAGRYFARVLARSARDRDALVGQALVDERSGAHEAALERIEAVLKSHPADDEAKETRKRLEAVVSPRRESHAKPEHPPATLDLPMRVKGRFFEIRDDGGGYRPIFLKAIDLGTALPGRFPSEFPLDGSLYSEWFEKMKACGFHAVRVYTILPPVFYDTLAEFNRERPDPLYLVHGAWIELPEDHDFTDPDFVESYRSEIRRVVDALHGALDLPVRRGHAGGRYRSDVSRYWIATILGREWEPYAVAAFDARHPDHSDYLGRFVAVRGATASERWQAEQTDYAIAYEADRWNAQRPTAWTNWPTLDPLYHPTESTFKEEAVWSERLGLEVKKARGEVYDDDVATMDMEKFEAGPENQGGLFASYHVYPYHPDFMGREYLQARDSRGPNAYFGYVKDLVAHHRKHPVFIGEFGVPTSRDTVHLQPQGWTHGGHGEKEQGEINGRLWRSIHEAGATGAAQFAWIDEWFKHTWITRSVHLPADRNPLWHDRQDPEQNFGLIGYRAGGAIIIDGKDADWPAESAFLRAAEGSAGRLRSLAVRSDESDLYFLLKLEPGRPGGAAVGIDVVDERLGNVRFPGRPGVESSAGFEAALLFDGKSARVVVQSAYDRHANRDGKAVPKASPEGEFVSPRIVPHRLRITRDGTVQPMVVVDVGELRRGTNDRSDPAFDDRAEWQFDAEAGTAEFRIPWGLLNVTDPSSRSVLFESPEHPDGFRTTEGFRFAVASLDAPGTGDVLETLPPLEGSSRLPALPLYQWKTWDEPTYRSFEKLSYDIVRKALLRVPDVPGVVVRWTADRLDDARAARDAGRLEEGIRLYRELIDDPDDTVRGEALEGLALLQSWRGEYSDAVTHYRMVRDRFPERRKAAIHGAARTLGWARRYEEALTELDQGLRDYPDDKAQILLEAQVAGWGGRTDRSVAAFRRVMEIDSEDREARLGLAKVLSWGGRLPESEVEFKKLLFRHPDDEAGLMGMTYTVMWQGRPHEAEEWFSRLGRESEGSKEYRIAQTALEWALGERALARRHLRELMREFPGEPDVRDLWRAQTGEVGTFTRTEPAVLRDADDLEVQTLSLHAAAPLADPGSVFGEGRQEWLEKNGDAVGVKGGRMGIDWVFGRRWRVRGSLGARRSDVDSGGWTGGGTVSRMVRPDRGFSVGVDSDFAFDTPLAVRSDVRMSSLTLAAWTARNSRLSVSAAYSRAHYAASEGSPRPEVDQNRDTLTVKARHYLLGHKTNRVDVGALGYFLRFDRTFDTGYWNPRRFRQVMGTVAGQHRGGEMWTFIVEGGLGVQSQNDQPWGPAASVHGEFLHQFDRRMDLTGRVAYGNSGLARRSDSSGYWHWSAALGVQIRLGSRNPRGPVDVPGSTTATTTAEFRCGPRAIRASPSQVW